MTLKNDAAACRIELTAKNQAAAEREKRIGELTDQLSNTTAAHSHLQQTFTQLHEQVEAKPESNHNFEGGGMGVVAAADRSAESTAVTL